MGNGSTGMINLSVYNKDGQEVESLKVDELIFGGSVNYALLKQACISQLIYNGLIQ